MDNFKGIFVLVKIGYFIMRGIKLQENVPCNELQLDEMWGIIKKTYKYELF